ncbi:MAG: HU family DNA-binding protein [Spirochaetes bacterium]|nr:HU family DNA-binding protein [Spirochaetota bacterium]
MHQRDLVRDLAREAGLPQSQIKACLDAFLEGLSQELQNDRDVEIPDFGRFHLVDQGERRVKPPGHAEALTVPARKRLAFEPHRELGTRLETLAPNP